MDLSKRWKIVLLMAVGLGIYVIVASPAKVKEEVSAQSSLSAGYSDEVKYTLNADSYPYGDGITLSHSTVTKQ
jgi:hypothetical protein